MTAETPPPQRRGSAWPPLLLAIVLEVAATLSLRAVATGGAPWWAIATVIGYGGAFWLLGMVLTRGMPVGVAYGIWSAVGVALTALAAAALFSELLSPLSLVGLVVIMAGVLMAELGRRHAGEREP
ncbi:DMT family transporter [Microbacterium resistens]|uniref:QacE family quaternary ammonium compound efflux SMR transporter n=1 Tax=Microbacterium resistens TaxID=156977 RepID=A0ABY3RVN3_9MICO|nr:SMR family transporter [Microbacterium resistens]MBW1638424.1 QacE family quaternary ammonium compound efflux SMR transporter [Microbacterium resistens]UGS28128.1 QacE family quaternary ammonium compound efflux SMR transporter [Microbacterium resistens]